MKVVHSPSKSTKIQQSPTQEPKKFSPLHTHQQVGLKKKMKESTPAQSPPNKKRVQKPGDSKHRTLQNENFKPQTPLNMNKSKAKIPKLPENIDRSKGKTPQKEMKAKTPQKTEPCPKTSQSKETKPKMPQQIESMGKSKAKALQNKESKTKKPENVILKPKPPHGKEAKTETPRKKASPFKMSQQKVSEQKTLFNLESKQSLKQSSKGQLVENKQNMPNSTPNLKDPIVSPTQAAKWSSEHFFLLFFYIL